ncbi:MAG TPA: hypothetical protein VGX91_08810 [Candidatus Cybelea sp.]|jgi:hypothetical protein|nr:hypothetical protein [Candidatus Cybelea sp.]
MSDVNKQTEDAELDNVSGGQLSHPMPHDPIRPNPPTHPGGPVLDPIEPERPTNPAG